MRRCGDRALLVDLDDQAEVLGLNAALTNDRPRGVTEIIPAARTLFVGYDPAQTTFGRLAGLLADQLRRARIDRAQPAGRSGADEVQIPVVYDGPDLAEVARLAGMSEREVVALHSAARYTVAFCGFAPGFGYLVGGDLRLAVPRRRSPRTRVPAGAVGLAGEFTGCYPRESPGGWQLIGRTDAVLWDVERDPPALLAPGTAVRFVEAAK